MDEFDSAIESVIKFKEQLENEDYLKEKAVKSYNKIVEVMKIFAEIIFLLEGDKEVWSSYGHELYNIRKCITNNLPKIIKPILEEG